MANDVLSTFVKRKYILNDKGGNYGHTEDGALKIYKPGNEIWLTDEEAQQKSLVGRLTPVDEVPKVFTSATGAAAASDAASAAAAGDSGAVAAAIPVAATSAASTTPSTTPKTPATSVIPSSPSAATPMLPNTGVDTATAKRTKITDWSFVPKSLTETLVDLVDDLDDVADLKAMQAAEKSRNDGGRRRVGQAINSRMRQLNMAKARAAREAKLAEKRAKAGADNAESTSSGDTE